MMGQKAIYYAIAIIIVGILFLFGMNVPIFFQNKNTQKTQELFSLENIKGMAIEHKSKLYTLNFNQQTQMVRLLNNNQLSTYAKKTPEKLDFEKIVVYRFNQPDLEIVPLAFEQSQLLFAVDGKVFEELSNGKLKQLLTETYDP